MTNLAPHWTHDDIEALGGDFDGSLSSLCIMSLSFDFTRSGFAVGGNSNLGGQLGSNKEQLLATSGNNNNSTTNQQQASQVSSALQAIQAQQRVCGNGNSLVSGKNFSINSNYGRRNNRSDNDEANDNDSNANDTATSPRRDENDENENRPTNEIGERDHRELGEVEEEEEVEDEEEEEDDDDDEEEEEEHGSDNARSLKTIKNKKSTKNNSDASQDLASAAAAAVGANHQHHGQESMFGLEQVSKQRFQYILAAPISAATKVTEDTMTYLNQGQAYEIKLKNVTDISEGKKGFMCSIINIGFHERHMQQAENELWQQWSQQHPGERIFSVDMKLSHNVFGVESDGLNKYEFLWDSSKAAGVFIRINSISTEFTLRKHGGEKGIPFKLSIETFSYNSKTHDSYFISAACCQIKVFKPKGAERKIRSDRDKLLKRPLVEQDKYHCSSEQTTFCECPLSSLHPMVDGSLGFYRHSHGHFASKQIEQSTSVTPAGVHGQHHAPHNQHEQQQQQQQQSQQQRERDDGEEMEHENQDNSAVVDSGQRDEQQEVAEESDEGHGAHFNGANHHHHHNHNHNHHHQQNVHSHGHAHHSHQRGHQQQGRASSESDGARDGSNQRQVYDSSPNRQRRHHHHNQQQRRRDESADDAPSARVHSDYSTLRLVSTAHANSTTISHASSMASAKNASHSATRGASKPANSKRKFLFFLAWLVSLAS